MMIIGSQPEENAPKTIKPKSEPVAVLAVKPAKEEKKIEKIRKIPIQLTQQKSDPATTADKKDPESELIKTTPKTVPKVARTPEPKIESPVQADPAKSIVLGNITKLSDPAGECTVKNLRNEDEVVLLGKIKSLKIAGAQGKAVLDASELEAQEILFAGDILGDSQVKLYAPRGSVVIQGVVQGSSRLEVIAPGGGRLDERKRHEHEWQPEAGHHGAACRDSGCDPRRRLHHGHAHQGGILEIQPVAQQHYLHYGKANYTGLDRGSSRASSIPARTCARSNRQKNDCFRLGNASAKHR